jgi:hypothetical protein
LKQGHKKTALPFTVQRLDIFTLPPLSFAYMNRIQSG